MTRRKRNEGSIRLRADGRYEVRVNDPISGKRRSLFGRTEDEAVSELHKAHKSIGDGYGIVDGRTTVSSYLTWWIEIQKPKVRDSTWRKYEQCVRVHLVPGLGRVKLRALTATHLETFYTRLLDKLKPQSVAHVHRVLHKALRDATRQGKIARNVASGFELPKIGEQEARSLSRDQVHELLKASDGTRHHALFVLACSTGMRVGELLALRWEDVDTDGRKVSVRRTLAGVFKGVPNFQEPKTSKSRRTISIGGNAAEALRVHRVRQKEEELKAIGWEKGGLVFPDAVGRAQHSSNFYRDIWVPLRDKAGLPKGFTFHGLRHTAASLALSAGMPVADVSGMLGHANASITYRIYTHAIPGDDLRLANMMDSIVSRANS